mmetsp:Transcript_46985/g.135355  ORF Transcript_46985/g.135355 Transcript_46985/m.135355 type:complete len:592 (+) Transcript_46985:66-1841(+)|eukprot:CAMPEP_0176065926 /NCGR_PEP_ID=MMETSP0120_2-20121206/32897_1 /TAXON_ID=160619 /ORGANISM="Kryptoperidinium foliaceum, Strain CCMP 1326" /LENGTH=591 /DNA_ID=CAMNT_0017399527 /DNA_START=63 /DNA_END=1838 /DNA_ORIENTATION=+
MASPAGIVSGLGAASALLQAPLGVGIFLTGIGIGISSDAEVRKSLAGVPWESTLRGAARAAGQMPLLAAFALVQASGAAQDMFTSLGLAAAGTVAFLSTLLALLDLDAERASRALSAIGAFGGALLVFAAWPSGTQLLCASALLRAAVGVQAASAVARALKIGAGPTTEVLADLDVISGLAPALAGVALIDNSMWGAGTITTLPMQPSIFVLALLALVALARAALGARVIGTELVFKLKVDGSTDKAWEPLRFAMCALVYLSMAAAFVRIALGTFRVEVSTSGFAIHWSEPLAAASVKLMALIFGIYAAELMVPALKSEAETTEEPDTADPPINGMEMPSSSTAHGLGFGEPLPAIHYFKALAAPASVLLLAMVAMRMSTENAASDDDESSFPLFSMLLGMPFKYGFSLAGAGVILQVLTLAVYMIGKGGEGCTEPPVDTTGTLMWQPHGGVAQKVASSVRFATLTLLAGGLILGCLGLGASTFILQGLVAAVAWYLKSSAEARQKANDVIAVGTSAMFSSVGEFLERRRLEQEAAAARRAAAVAKDLVAETASSKPAGGAGPGAKGVKGPSSKAGATSSEKKDGVKRRNR